MSAESPTDDTAAHGIEEGYCLVLRAEDSGDWKAVADWLARNTDHAAALADYLAALRGLHSATAPLRTLPDRVGAHLGEFELKDELGRGGMGVVYRAFDKTLKREVAVKLLRTGNAFSAAESARFRFEAEMVASLHHPNIVPVHSCGEADGVPYLVMPLMTGGSLAAWLKNLGPDRCLPPKKAAKIARDVAFGVHHAHQRGLIHRDIKPANILLDHTGAPHVADFGLARRVDCTASSTAEIAGTFLYMAPEQGRGAKDLTIAVDVHAIGVVLFELLTGGVPYGGSDIASILRRLTDETEPAPPASRFRRDVPTDLEAICVKCLERRPEDRYLSAQALADALERYLNDEPQVDASRRGWATDLARVVRRRVDTPSMAIWPAFFWGLGSLSVSQATIQIAVLTDSPLWVAYLGWGIYFGGWLVVLWLCGLARLHLLTRIEKAGIAQHIGMMLGGLALIPSSFAIDEYGLALYPPLMVLIALGTFVQGSYHWGRYFVLGGLMFLLTAIMSVVFVRYLPTAFAVQQITAMIWVGFRTRSFDREARTVAS
ncbi:MAG: serine/threonine protein kinase [Planctomycetes bacterium]|nr:serine/threonine protein kinase [Planctomycetota bacterium]